MSRYKNYRWIFLRLQCSCWLVFYLHPQHERSTYWAPGQCDGRHCAGLVVLKESGKAASALQGTSTWCLKVTSLCVRCSMPALKTPFTPRTTESTTSRCRAAGCDARMWVEPNQAGHEDPPKLRNLGSRDPRHALLFCGTLDWNRCFSARQIFLWSPWP